jgi:hypothetical protein
LYSNKLKRYSQDDTDKHDQCSLQNKFLKNLINKTWAKIHHKLTGLQSVKNPTIILNAGMKDFD